MHIAMTANAAWNILNFRLPILNALLGEGHNVTVVAPPDDSVTTLKTMGCRFVPLDMSVKGLNPLEGVRLIRSFTAIFSQLRPDVALSYTIKNNIFGAIAAQFSRVPFIPNVTGLGTAFLSGRLLQTVAEGLYRRAFGTLPVIFFQNEDDLDLFVCRGLVQSGQARVLPGSGIDLDRFAAVAYPAAENPPLFLMIARVLRDKGVVEFVEAAQKVKMAAPHVRFQLLGAVDTENRSAISAAKVHSWMADGAIEYLGSTDDVRPYITAAHCVVLPSYREGAPRTLIEAAAMARPIIATDVPGCRAVVDRDISGFLCAARSADDLTAAVVRFLDMPHSAKIEMGLAGRAKMAREFDEAIVVSAYREAIAAATLGMQGCERTEPVQSGAPQKNA